MRKATALHQPKQQLKWVQERTARAPVIRLKARTVFAQKRLKSRSVGGFRPDVMYIASALKTFANQGSKGCRAIALEVAMLGRTGLDINDPGEKYQLKSLPGTFSGLHLLAIMYTAFQQIDPTMDTRGGLRRGVPSGARDAPEVSSALPS